MKTFRTDSGYLLKLDSNQIRAMVMEHHLKNERELEKIGYKEIK